MMIYDDIYENNEWRSYGKYTFEYLNNKVETISYSLNEENVYLPFTKHFYTYNNDKLTSITMKMNANISEPDSEPLWIDVITANYYYNTQNHLSLVVTEFTLFQPTTARVHFTYENNRVKSIINYEVDDDSGQILFHKSDVEYDGNGRAAQMIGYTSSDSTNWTQTDKIVLNYDPSDNSDYDNFQYVIDNSSQERIGFYYFYGNARINSEITYSWTGSVWDNSEKENFIFDPNWNVILNQEQEWVNNAWLTTNEREIAYINPQQVNYQISKELNNNIMVNTSRCRYEYSTANDNHVVFPSAIHISTYPNPFNGNTTVSVKANDNHAIVQLYNVKGQLISEEDMNLNRSNTVNFKTEYLSSGIYFVKVKTANETKTQKILKIK